MNNFCLKLLLCCHVLLLFISCKKPAEFIDKSERFPLEKVPPDIVSRVNEFSKEKNCQIDFLESGIVDKFTLRLIIRRTSQKTPPIVELDKLKAGEMFDFVTILKKKIFLGKPLATYKCIIVAITVVYYDNVVDFIFSD